MAEDGIIITDTYDSNDFLIATNTKARLITCGLKQNDDVTVSSISYDDYDQKALRRVNFTMRNFRRLT